ncbi:hypothetical protein [Luteimonas sp. A277]
MKKISKLPSLGLSMLALGTAACGDEDYVEKQRVYGEITQNDYKVGFEWSREYGGGGGGPTPSPPPPPSPDPPSPPNPGGPGGGGGGRDPGEPQLPFGMGGALRAMLASTDVLPDAAAFAIDVSGSTLTYPQSGMGVFTLKRADNYIVASQAFAWTKVGTLIKFTNPDAVNTWAYSNLGDATQFSFETNSFSPNFTGTRVVSLASKYEGQTTSSFHTLVSGECQGVTQHQCMIQ